MAAQSRDIRPAPLVPDLAKCIQNNLNVLLVGKHGVGKTQAIYDVCDDLGLRVKCFSCSTLDPYTDLVGVPLARNLCTTCNTTHHSDVVVCTKCGNRQLIETLKMVRPHEIDNCQVLFLDEFNRSEDKVLAAVFEIIQFRTINGERLPHLKCILAAMNPPDGTYKVGDLDPALADRFDVYYVLEPKISFNYMISKGMDSNTAYALDKWYEVIDQENRASDNYISPRRLEKIGRVREVLGTHKEAIPPWITDLEFSKLDSYLEKADQRRLQGRENPFGSDRIGDGPTNEIEYDPEWIQNNSKLVSDYLQGHPLDFDTHQEVVDTIKDVRVPKLVKDYSEVLGALKPVCVESLISGMTKPRQDNLKAELASLSATDPAKDVLTRAFDDAETKIPF